MLLSCSAGFSIVCEHVTHSIMACLKLVVIKSLNYYLGDVQIRRHAILGEIYPPPPPPLVTDRHKTSTPPQTLRHKAFYPPPPLF
jgi:hypothetical protein